MKIQRDGKEYTLTAEEVMEAHEEFVTSFIQYVVKPLASAMGI